MSACLDLRGNTVQIFIRVLTKILVLFRFEFYKQAKESFVIVHTGETALYGNIILQKGVIKA